MDTLPRYSGSLPLAFILSAFTGLALATVAGAQQGDLRNSPRYTPDIPRTWADEAVATFEIPLARPEFSAVHVPEEYYYRLPVRTIWKSYPIYHPDHEPDGYREQLASLKPQILFNESDPVTEQDWIEAGTHVFRAAIAYDGPAVRPGEVLDPAWYEANNIRLTSDGVFPYARWVIREPGKLEVGNLSCAMCHTRVMPDGSFIEGAQGNLPLDEIIAERIKRSAVPLAAVRWFSHALVDTPWGERAPFEEMTAEELAAIRSSVPPGVLVRTGTSFEAPVRIPDLIGIQDRKYLDATGLVRHRDVGDLMRYAASNVAMDMLARFGDYVPDSGTSDRPAPGEGRFPGTSDRFSDAQLFALAKFLYSLEPPPNPNRLDDLARRGQEVFKSQQCADCHTPPLYTNNKIVPAPGFHPPADHLEKYDVSERRVGTDGKLALTTRRGTGYYKVPSLKGLWYRGPLEHSGSIATLEDWFEPARLRDDYVPTGFAGADGPRRVPGHLFGLRLSAEDKRALIAFLKAL